MQEFEATAESRMTVSIREAAAILHVSPMYVEKLLVQGVLGAVSQSSPDGNVRIRTVAIFLHKAGMRRRQAAASKRVGEISAELGLYDGELDGIPPAPKPRATIWVQQRFDRVRMECDGEHHDCSLKTCLFELKLRKMTLLDVQIVDFDQSLTESARSRQCQKVYDAVFAAGLRDPILEAAKARRGQEYLTDIARFEDAERS